MPTVRQLEYLVALAKTRHFRRAAEQVGVSQPTLSTQLTALEERLGAQLVERSRARVLLTPVGITVEAVARRVLRDIEEIRYVAKSEANLFAGSLRLGLPPTLGPYMLPRIIPTLHQRHPDLKLFVREELPLALPDTLRDGQLDVIVTPMPLDGDDLEAVRLFREPLYLVMPADSPHAGRKTIDQTLLKGQPILTLGIGHQLREQVDAICKEHGASVRSDFEGTSLDMLRHMVATGVGWSFLPGFYVETNLRNDASVIVKRLKGRALYRTIGMAWRSTSARTSEYKDLASEFRDGLKAITRSL